MNEIVFSKKWFEKHQSKLLWLLNTPLTKRWFRWVLRIRHYDIPLKEKITHIAPNSFSWGDKLIKLNGEWRIEKTTDFRTHEKFAKRLYYAFKPMWYLIHFWDMAFANQVSPALNLGFDTLTKYPASGSGAPCSGYVRRNGVNESLATIRAGAGGTAYGYDNYLKFYLESDVSNSANNFYALYRALVGFDTSALTADAIISAATNGIYGGSEWTGGDAFSGTQPAMHTSQGTPNSESAFSTSDYAQSAHGTTSFGSIAAGAWSGAAYNNISLNASGLSAISKTGNSFFSWTIQWDIQNSFGGTWATGKRTGIAYGKGVNTTGTSQDPKLVVTYSIPVASGMLALLL